MMRCRLLLLAGLLLSLSAAADERPQSATETEPVSVAASVIGQAQEFALRALSFIGVRYKWGGSTPDAGFDCSGLIRYVYAQVTGQPLPAHARDARDISHVGVAVDSAELQPGDLVFFNTRRKPYSHVGIYLGESRFVHAPSRGGEVEIVDMRNRYWQTRYNGARRLPI